MRKVLVMLAFFAAVMIASSTSFAKTTYVVTNDDNCTTNNTSSIYTLNTTTGALTLLKSISTGTAGGCGGFFSDYEATVAQNAKCLFVYDLGTLNGNSGTTDIAAFTVPALKKVGNYTNASVNGLYGLGGSIALSPNGNFLYATYNGTENIGAWKVNAGCSLTFIAAYVPKGGADDFSSIKVTPDNHGLVVDAIDIGYVELFEINQTSGKLKDLGFASLTGFSSCSSIGCAPEAIDITGDSKEVILGNASVAEPAVFTASLTPSGPTNAAIWILTNTPNVENIDVPWLSEAAYKTGTGNLYLGGSGYTGGVPGVITANFSETSGITVQNATEVSSAGNGGIDGEIQTTGTWMVISEWFNTLQTFTINSNGSITPSAQGPVVDSNADGGLSFFIYPQTR